MRSLLFGAVSRLPRWSGTSSRYTEFVFETADEDASVGLEPAEEPFYSVPSLRS